MQCNNKTFLEPYKVGIKGVTEVTLDGAAMDKIAGKNIKFRRKEVEKYLESIGETLDTHFEVVGTFKLNGQFYKFFAEDDIKKIKD